jgi:beta-glucosidase
MRYGCLNLLIFSLLVASGCHSRSVYDPDEKYFRKADSLLSLLSLEEKAGQMTNIGLTALTEGPFWTDADTLVLDTVKMRDLLLNHHVGSVQNKGKYPPCREEWHRLVKSIQEYVFSHTRHKIPVLFGMDGVHGANYTAGSTLFPHQIGIAASWNPDHARIMGEVTAYELRASSLPCNYAPVLDVSMQPLWGRIAETFGEDTFLNRVMGVAFVEGSQGADLADSTRVAVCLKHFIGYGTPVSGKDRSPSLIPEHYLRQYYLEPFKDAIDRGALTVLLNSGALNGIPGHADYYMITRVLKGELGLKGFVISDWSDISRLYQMHGVAANHREATKLAVMAGVDMCMGPYDASFASDLIDLVEAGEVPMSRVDDAVRRILFVKYKLGLFEKAWHEPGGYTRFGSEEFATHSLNAALESITLLKNDDEILPIRNRDVRLLVTGPSSNSLTALNGPWSRTWKGDDPSYDDEGKQTFLEAMIEVYGKKNVLHDPGTDYEGDFMASPELYEKAFRSDILFVCLGEEPTTEKLSDIHSLDLPSNQLELVKYFRRTGKPVVLILLQGRPRIIREIEPYAGAILMAYWPGHEGGRALARLINGESNPSGKLPYTYPRYTNTLQTYQHKGSDKLDRQFGMSGFNPQWEFGHGLSYTSFSFDQLSMSSDTIFTGQNLTVSIEVSNTGKHPGMEVAQFYIRDLVASITPDDRKLIGFTKVFLQPGQRKEVSMTISYRDLKFVNLDNEWIAEPGAFELLVGGNPNELKAKRFYYAGST